ncbi:hypothetical protein ACFE04_008233 [Oxalis oulophora]
MDLDINQQALLDTTTTTTHGSNVELESVSNESESTHGQIEECFRQLEAVSLRARNRQQQRAPQIINLPTSATTVAKNSTELIAKALEMVGETSDKGETSGTGGGSGFYDCNICLRQAKEPILTCCGHLFCWSCYYHLSYYDSNVKECPVCKGEVKDTSIVPIYGNVTEDKPNCNKEYYSNIIKVPPRPGAHRVESWRQQLMDVISILMDEGSSSAMESVEGVIEYMELVAYIHSHRLRRSNQQLEPSIVDQREIATTTSTSTGDSDSDAENETTSHPHPHPQN